MSSLCFSLSLSLSALSASILQCSQSYVRLFLCVLCAVILRHFFTWKPLLTSLRPACPPAVSRSQTSASVLYNEDGQPLLLRDRHAIYMRRGYEMLSSGFICLDASRTWILYWITHGLDLLGASRTKAGTPAAEAAMAHRIIGAWGGSRVQCFRFSPCTVRVSSDTLTRCQHPEGGFGGGPQQLAHCAPTYSAVLALLIVDAKRAAAVIDRRKLYAFYMRMKHPSGGFHMHHGGEVDIRATYTVMAIATLLNICTPELKAGVAEYILSCVCWLLVVGCWLLV